MSDHSFEPTGRPGEFGDLSPFTLERAEYLGTCSAAVRCLPVRLQGRLLGYLWASVSDADDAAGWRPVHGAGAIGFDAGGTWLGRFKRARDKGMSPSEALRQWIGAPEDPRGGGVPAGAEERILPSSDAVTTLSSQAPRWGD